MKPVLAAYFKAAIVLAASPFIAIAAGFIVFVATWKSVISGLAGVRRET